jgi:hypothetical protein
MDHYLVVAKIRERLAVNRQEWYKFYMERFNLKKLNEVEGKEKYRIEVSKRFAALEDLNAEVEFNTIWETIRENPLFYEGCSKLLDQRNQANCSDYMIQVK